MVREAGRGDNAVQSFVRKDCGVTFDAIRQTFAVLGAFGAAHLKNIGEVRVKLKHKHQANRFETVVQHANVFVAASLSEELRTENMDGAPRQTIVAV